jgi:hypothetical protein
MMHYNSYSGFITTSNLYHIYKVLYCQGLFPDATTGQYHPTSGYIYGVGKNMFDRLEDDEHADCRQDNPYFPFEDEGEWELGRFLVENMNQTQINKFLKLKWVGMSLCIAAQNPNLNLFSQFNTHAKPTFTSKDQLLSWVDALPSFAEWKVTKLEFTGYKTTHPINLIWRDALEVVKQLFSDPAFANHITFDPHIVHDGTQREYGDFMSADFAWKIQVYLPSYSAVHAVDVLTFLG